MMTAAEIADAIRRALATSPDQSGAVTSWELAQEMNCSYKTVLMRIRPLVKAGTIKVVSVPRAGIDGRIQNVTAYVWQGTE